MVPLERLMKVSTEELLCLSWSNSKATCLDTDLLPACFNLLWAHYQQVGLIWNYHQLITTYPILQKVIFPC